MEWWEFYKPAMLALAVLVVVLSWAAHALYVLPPAVQPMRKNILTVARVSLACACLLIVYIAAVNRRTHDIIASRPPCAVEVQK